MLAPSHPISRLTMLAEQRATGELVAASSTGETHVYLQRGRIAWATDSRIPEGFAGHLQEVAGLAADTLREVTDECRRGRLPLGETLVSWGFATPESLRLALHRQLRDALAMLSDERGTETLFLPRDWPTHDAELTFGLDEVIATPVSPVRADPTADETAAMLRDRVDGLAWVEVFDADVRVDADPPDAAVRTAPVLRAILGDGADFVVLREGGHSEVGMGSQGRSLWCHIAEAATLGGTLTALPDVGGVLRPAVPPKVPMRSIAPCWTLGEGALLSALAAFVGRAQDVVAAVVFTDATDEPVAGVGHVSSGADVFASIARRRRAALDVELATGRPESRSMVTGERMTAAPESAAPDPGTPDCWCFGARLAAPAEVTLWLFLDRACAQGLGWAYLSVCGRQIADAIVPDGRTP